MRHTFTTLQHTRRPAWCLIAMAHVLRSARCVGAAMAAVARRLIGASAEHSFVGGPHRRAAAAPSRRVAQRLDPELVYPADVLRVIDGDTFEARVRVWPGLDVDTKVRLRGIDAAELHARCGDELAKAQAARAALETHSRRRRRRPFRASASTSMAGASMRWPRPAAPPTYQRRCSAAAVRAATTAETRKLVRVTGSGSVVGDQNGCA